MTPTDELSPEARKQLASELSGKLAEALKPEPITTPMSLYGTSRRRWPSLANCTRKAARGRRTPRDADALAIDSEIAAYHVAAEVQKVDNCAALRGYAKDAAERIQEGRRPAL